MSKLDTIKSRIEKLGYTIDREQRASTGTTYLYIERGEYQVKVRVADHTEMYPPALNWRQISISPDELTIAQAMKVLADPESITPYTLTDEEIAEKKNNEKRWANDAKNKASRFAKVKEAISDEDWDLAKEKHNINVCRKIVAKYPDSRISATILKTAVAAE